MAIDLGSYNDVAARIAEFREKCPEGRLRPANLNEPYKIEKIGNETFIVFVAACYRTPDDAMPGIGTAWEIFPGKTNYTRGSELQNAETSAWGRAIVAALQADTRKGVASAEEVRNRQAERDEEAEAAFRPRPPAVTAAHTDAYDLASKEIAACESVSGLNRVWDSVIARGQSGELHASHFPKLKQAYDGEMATIQGGAR